MTLFRDTYKAANNDIKPDSALLAKTLSRIEERKKAPVISFRTLSACAAALFVTVGSLYGYMRYITPTVDDNISIAPSVVRMDTNLESAAKGDNTAPAAADNLQTDVSPVSQDSIVPAEQTQLTEKKSEVSMPAEAPAPVEKAVPAPVSENRARTVPEEVSDSVALPAPLEDAPADEEIPAFSPEEANKAVVTDENPKKSHSGSSGGGGGSSAAVRPNEISYSQYSSYIGRDLYASLTLPRDMAPDRWSSAPFGEANDEVTFSYTGADGRKAYITSTKNTEKIYDLINSSTASDKTENRAFVYEKALSTAYMVNGNVGYTVNCFGFTEDEFTQLIDSVMN